MTLRLGIYTISIVNVRSCNRYTLLFQLECRFGFTPTGDVAPIRRLPASGAFAVRWARDPVHPRKGRSSDLSMACACVRRVKIRRQFLWLSCNVSCISYISHIYIYIYWFIYLSNMYIILYNKIGNDKSQKILGGISIGGFTEPFLIKFREFLIEIWAPTASLTNPRRAPLRFPFAL